jgi:YesN/AraC family two-component response regulator
MKKEKIFFSYLFSYLFVVIISLVLSIIGYTNSENIVEKEILSSQTSMLTQLHYNFDNYLRTVINSNQSLSNNENINSLMYNSDFSQNQLLKITKLKSELNSYKKGMDICTEIAVYFYNSDNFVTNNKRYMTEISYLYPKKYGFTHDDFIEFIDIPDFQGYRIIKNETKTDLLFMQNIYSYQNRSKLATIIIVVPWENIAESIAADDVGSVFWINQENQMLHGITEDDFSVTYKYSDFKAENELIFTKTDNISYVSSYKQSKFFDLKYCISMPKSTYFQQLNYMKLIIIVQLAITLLIAVGIGIYYSYKNYHPLSNIMDLFQKYNKISGDPISLDKLETNLQKLLAENTNLNDTCHQSKVEQAISGFVKGWHSDISVVRETLTTTDYTSLKEDRYILFLATYQDVSKCKLITDNTTKEEAEVYQLLKYIFKNVFDEKILSKYNGLLCNIDGIHLFILNINDQELDEATLTNDINECAKWYMQALNLKIFIAGSNIHNRYDDLTKAYNEASQVQNYHSFWGNENESLVYYDESGIMEEAKTGNEVQFLDNEKRLYNLLVAKEYDNAYILLDQMMDEMFIRDIKYMEINQCRMYSLINTIFICLNDIVGKNDEMYIQNLQHMKNMFKANSIEAAKSVMKDIFNEIIGYMESNLAEEQPKWIMDVINYVNEHYTNENLNISTIADTLNMNLSYVGRTFKKHVGYCLTDFIHMQRLKECKRRLEAGASVKDTAEAVGYLDSKTLIRIFKKYEGITPGQFKNNTESVKKA